MGPIVMALSTATTLGRALYHKNLLEISLAAVQTVIYNGAMGISRTKKRKAKPWTK